MSLNGKRILVTGSSGFVGRHLVARLQELGSDVLTFDIVDGQDIARWEDFEHIDTVDIVYHLAAVVFVPRSQDSPRTTYQTNILGTTNALELCRQRSARIIFASSYIYGTPHYLPIDEQHPVHPTNPYARSKVLGELLCEAYQEDYAVPCVVLRPFNIYGEGQARQFLIPEILGQLKTGKEVVLKDLTPRRDFLYIQDAVDAYVKAAEFGGGTYEIFNIGSGESFSVKEIAEKMAHLMNADVPIRSLGETRRGEIPETVADISKSAALLNWKPRVDLESGLRKIIGS